jgi:uncharacterized protein YbjT (DUF2867 family)
MKIIITGASGMVGEGVLLECLQTKDVNEILVVGRRPCGHQHPKLREVLHDDFLNLAPIEKELAGYDACFFCLGVSSVRISPEAYKKLTYDLTLEMGKRLASSSPNLTFCYVTGMGTDSTEKGSLRWARVKGATENELLRLFKNAYMFRPGAMTAVSGQKNLKLMYKAFVPLIPIFKPLFPNSVCTLGEVGRAMLTCARSHPAKHIVEVRDIKTLANVAT